jgi:hypothetical protein
MGDIIQFPKKEKFIDKYGSHLPKELKECLSLVYDEIIEKSNNLPMLDLRVSADQIEKVNKFKEEYRTSMIELLSELLIEKANSCISKHNL